MPDLPALLEAWGVRDQALAVLAAVTLALLVLSLLFAAYTVFLRIENVRRERRRERLRERWEEPLLLALADPASAAELHALVAPGERMDFVRFVQGFARRLKGEELEVLRSIAAPYLDLVAARARNPRREIRTRAVQTLGELGLPAWDRVVVGALDDESPLVAMVAARGLASEGRLEHAASILARLGRFKGWREDFLASLLAGMGHEGAPALRAALGDRDREPWVRGVAARALLLLSDLEAADLAARVVEAEDDPDLLRPTLRLLAQVGRPEHAEVIRARCASPRPAVRSEALRALGTLAEDDDRMRLLGAMADPSPWVAMSAARGLLAGGGEQLLRDLVESDHPRSRLAAEILEEEAGP